MGTSTLASPSTTLKSFQDRIEPRGVFWKTYCEMLLAMPQPKDTTTELPPSRVLVYHGIGGIGKTEMLTKLKTELDGVLSEEPCPELAGQLKAHLKMPLLEKLKKRMKKSKPITTYADYDFHHTQDKTAAAVLRQLSADLRSRRGFEFPKLSWAFYRLALKQYGQADAPEVTALFKEFPELDAISAILSTVTSGEAASAFGLAAPVINLATKLYNHCRQRSREKNPVFAEISQMDSASLIQALPRLFAEDLNANIKKLQKSANPPLLPIVVFLDTYEQLVATNSTERYDRWIWDEDGLIQQIPGVLWVIAGRDRVDWNKHSFYWQNNPPRHELLGGLSAPDTCAYFSEAGISNKELQEDLYQLTHGTPLYLYICAKHYHNCKKQTGKEPTLDSFGKSPEELVLRYIGDMNTSEQTIMFILAALQSWTKDVWEMLKHKLSLGMDLSLVYEHIIAHSFVHRAENGRYMLHKEMSDVLQDAEIGQTTILTVGKALIELFGEMLKGNPAYDAEFLQALLYTTRGYLLCNREPEALCEVFRSKLIPLLFDVWNAGLHQQTDSIRTMLKRYVSLLKNSLLYALWLVMETVNCYTRGEHEAALHHSAEAISLFKRLMITQHPDYLFAQHHRAVALANNGFLDEAEELARTVLDQRIAQSGEHSRESTEIRLVLAQILKMRGNNVQAQGLEVTAQRFFTKARELEEAALDAHNDLSAEDPFLHKIKLALAETYTLLGLESEKTQKLLDDIQKSQKTVWGDEDPRTRHTTQAVIKFKMQTGDIEFAINLQEKLIEDVKRNCGEHSAEAQEQMNRLIQMRAIADSNKDLVKHSAAADESKTDTEAIGYEVQEDKPDTSEDNSDTTPISILPEIHPEAEKQDAGVPVGEESKPATDVTELVKPAVAAAEEVPPALHNPSASEAPSQEVAPIKEEKPELRPAMIDPVIIPPKSVASGWQPEIIDLVTPPEEKDAPVTGTAELLSSLTDLMATKAPSAASADEPAAPTEPAADPKPTEKAGDLLTALATLMAGKTEAKPAEEATSEAQPAATESAEKTVTETTPLEMLSALDALLAGKEETTDTAANTVAPAVAETGGAAKPTAKTAPAEQNSDLLTSLSDLLSGKAASKPESTAAEPAPSTPAEEVPPQDAVSALTSLIEEKAKKKPVPKEDPTPAPQPEATATETAPASTANTLTVLENVLDYRMRTLGENAPDTWRAMADLAKAYSDAGIHPKAKNLVNQLLGLQKAVLGSKHPEILATMRLLESCLTNAEDFTGATAVQLEIAVLLKEIGNQAE